MNKNRYLIKKIYLFIIIILLLSANYNNSNAALIKKAWGWRPFNKYLGSTISLNPDKSYSTIYFDFKTREVVDMTKTKELELYKNLFIKSLIPSFLLFELTYYPLTDFGAYLFKHKKNFYDSTSFNTPNLGIIDKFNVNIIKAMASRYEQPYSFSLFLGEILPFLLPTEKEPSPDSRFLKGKKPVGSALMGFALSWGDRRMKKMELLSDKWWYLAWKIRGSRKTNTQNMAWRFEIGYLHHNNKEFIRAIAFSILRDRADTEQKHFSLLHNSKIEYSCHIPVERISKGTTDNSESISSQTKSGSDITKYTTFQKLVIGINFPLNKKFVFTTEFGVKWEALKALDKERPESELSLIFVPGLKW